MSRLLLATVLLSAALRAPRAWSVWQASHSQAQAQVSQAEHMP